MNSEEINRLIQQELANLRALRQIMERAYNTHIPPSPVPSSPSTPVHDDDNSDNDIASDSSDEDSSSDRRDCPNMYVDRVGRTQTAWFLPPRKTNVVVELFYDEHRRVRRRRVRRYTRYQHVPLSMLQRHSLLLQRQQ